MRFTTIADTDIGIAKQTNQDSVLIKHANTDDGEVVMAIVCDGMGGLAKGELASATVVRKFSDWFDTQLPYELGEKDIREISAEWVFMLKQIADEMLEYGNRIGNKLGTTFSGILFIKEEYVIVHIGDSRVYKIDVDIKQLTTDHTFVAREIAKGTMTLEEAKKDKRRNMLLQCIGASKNINPEVLFGDITSGVYMVCSDGFRHKVTPEEIQTSLYPTRLLNKTIMHEKSRYLIEEVKRRNEKDNISVVVIKVD